MRKIFAGLLGLCGLTLTAAEQEMPEKYWDFSKLTAPPAYKDATFPESQREGMRAILFDGVPYKGKAAPVFAYIAYPKTAKPAGGFPGIVLVHGGGGTAFSDAVNLWTSQGYAVIAPDWYNQYPVAAWQKKGQKPSKPMAGGWRNDIPTNVQNLILAHSLLRSLPDVNPEKTAYVGLSWGSWYGAIVASLDNRFKGVIEIYCGDRTPDRKRHPLIDGRFLHAAKVPMYWVCDTNDQNVTPESLQLAWDETPTVRNKTLVRKLGHSHVGFKYPACFRMAAHFLKGEANLPKVGKPTLNNGVATAKLLERGKGVKKCIFVYTTDKVFEKSYQRVWKEVPAKLDGDTLSVKVPEGTALGFFSVYDDLSSRFRDCCGSSDLIKMD